MNMTPYKAVAVAVAKKELQEAKVSLGTISEDAVVP